MTQYQQFVYFCLPFWSRLPCNVLWLQFLFFFRSIHYFSMQCIGFFWRHLLQAFFYWLLTIFQFLAQTLLKLRRMWKRHFWTYFVKQYSINVSECYQCYSNYNHGQSIWDKQFSCKIGHYGKSSISISQEFFASIEKFFILGGRLSTRL